MRLWLRRSLAVVSMALVLAGSAMTTSPLALDAAASTMESNCGRGDTTLVKTVPFKRDGKVLDYATLQVRKVSGTNGSYCVAVGSEYKRKMWVKGASCRLNQGKWNCNAGYDYASLGTRYSFNEDLEVRPSTRQSMTFRLKTASGNYYYAPTGWLYG